MTAKRHHAVPQFYLKRFTGPDGLVWLHDIERRVAVRVHPQDAIVEKYLYAPEVGENPLDDSLEQFLGQHVETPAAPALDKLSRGDALSSEDRQHIATFLAFQEVRIPRMRDSVTSFVSEIGQRILELSAQNPESIKATMAEAGHEVSEQTLANMIAGVMSGAIKVQATKVGWLESVAGTQEIAELLFRMPWTIVEAYGNVEFLTSDAPIVKILTDRHVPSQFGGGWLSPSAESTFALDPFRCLVIRPDGKDRRIAGTKQWCKDVNARLIRQARRFVVSQTRDAYVEVVALKRAKRKLLREASSE